MVERMPRSSQYEPLDLINAFLAREQRSVDAEEAAARQLEMLPIQQKMDIAKMEAAKRLGIQYLGPELDIRDAVAARQEGRAEARGMRERTHSADQQIRANEHQLTRSSELGEDRAIRQGIREHGFWKERQAELEGIDTRKSAREQEEAATTRQDVEKIRREGKHFDEPFAERQTDRTLKLQEQLIKQRAAEAEEAIRLRGEEARRTQAENWINKGKFYESHPEMIPGVRSGKINMIEEGIVGIKPDDVVTLGNAKKEVDKYEYLGAGQNAKGELVEKFRLKKPAAQGTMVPSPGSRQAPAAGTRNPWEGQTAPAPAPTGKATTPPVSTPKGDKSGERIQRSEINWRSTVEEAPDSLRNLFTRVGERYDLSPDLLASMMKQESGYRNSATSHAGAEGTMQFMPATAARFNVDSRDPVSSVVGAAKYINKMLGMFDDNIGLALAGYNWGEGGKNSERGVHAWLRAGADPRRMPEETRNYVQSITGKPIEHWVQKFFNEREGVTKVPKVTPTNQKTAEGDDLFYVDVG